jgi:general secretion pathway protein E
MAASAPPAIADFLDRLSRQNLAVEGFAVELVDCLLDAARQAGASDIHAQPVDAGDSLAILWRLNGVLQPIATVPRGKQNVIARLKVIADLLTYQTEKPQEGRIRRGGAGIEMRLSTFPTIHGEKAVVRLFIADESHRTLDQLGLPSATVADLKDQLAATSGVILVAGPAGSGKTTTLYACLRHLSEQSPPRGMSSLEDPVEAIIPGVAQSQVKPPSGFTYATALKSLLRQDPEVIMVGEIRDR